MRRMWGKVKWLPMKLPILLKVVSSIQAQRINLKAYGKIELSERGKVETQSDYTQ